MSQVVSTMTVREVCRALSLSRATLYRRLASDPRFPVPRREGSRKLFCAEAIKRYWESLPKEQ